ncbi:lipoyl domain-containing protein [Azoarcus sp. L1K30]|uniref:lipoyl domain-containing protein n=1 Tax=Azoarcus sp. L1K30 TaxID=2820277 RepID=UPI001B822833|nr:lipoyl domain-containing protein [Azoarcus sp. L1K30]MBR0567316.1 lipoyl domain-containing protein [Azoarcus sp. L1K30]
MTDIVMDDAVWADVEEGTEALLQEWQVAEGDSVDAGQIVAVAELVKTTHEILAPCSGKVTALKVAVDDTFGRGAVLAVIEG